MNAHNPGNNGNPGNGNQPTQDEVLAAFVLQQLQFQTASSTFNFFPLATPQQPQQPQQPQPGNHQVSGPNNG